MQQLKQDKEKISCFYDLITVNNTRIELLEKSAPPSQTMMRKMDQQQRKSLNLLEMLMSEMVMLAENKAQMRLYTQQLEDAIPYPEVRQLQKNFNHYSRVLLDSLGQIR